jgi:protein-L-isoaspartate(D-aspartate) O-methyltransferase
LDVGSGSGYLTAVIAHMIGTTGRVLGIDIVPQLVSWSMDNIRRSNPDLLKGVVTLAKADGWQVIICR